MTPSNDKISSIQLLVFIYNIILGVGILTLPSTLAKAAEQDAWILCLISGLINIVFIYFMCKVGVKYSEDGFVLTLQKVFGKLIGTVLAIPVFAYFVIFAGLETRIFAETVKVFLLSNTPLEYIILPLLLLAVFLARSGVEPIARFFEAITPAIMLVGFISLIVPIPNSDFSNIKPILTTPISKMLSGMTSGTFAFAGFEILLILFPYLKKPKEAFKASSVALIAVVLAYTLFTIESLAKFGVKETEALIYPTMTLLKASEVPGAFVERLEGVLLAGWVLFVYTTVVALVYGCSVIGGDLLKHKKRKHIISLFIPVMYVISLSGDSIPELFKMVDTLSLYLGSYTIVLLPIATYIISLIRGKGGKKNEEQNDKT